METLTPIQNRVLCLLAAGYDFETIANETGASMRSLSRWKNDSNFKKQLSRALTEIYRGSIAEIINGNQQVIRELKRIIFDPDTPTKIKVSAISVYLGNSAKIREFLIEEKDEGIYQLDDLELTRKKLREIIIESPNPTTVGGAAKVLSSLPTKIEMEENFDNELTFEQRNDPVFLASEYRKIINQDR